ncbi:DUF3616 domain-containing protein [Pseudorhodoferax sp. Leaf267]|uniref:DUF3616 domain-containing protein n=1 Tax=Pseudorhodoferax sp. Leaf267 TaxID=1736316 RepID=UPI0006FC405F|nr:DUF3616 domain-containing protein [Pseudorhodoferax sp. Leaf267]KQP18326.1 hypothetical protein ASF43_10950 [Pseudorhodoferax sp. Leaf267]
MIRPFHPTLRLAVLALGLHAWQAQAQTPPPAIAPAGKPWSTGAGFEFADQQKKTRQSVSGIACAPNAAGVRMCLVVFDEGTQARFAEVDAGRVVPQPGGVLFGVPGKELDAEGAATDGRFFYVTGSHAVKRSDCAPNEASQYVLRFARDGATGQALPPAPGAVTPGGYQHTRRLRALFANDFQLQPSLGVGRCLGTGALDIEALAVRDGRLHFGLRGPTEADHAFIASVDADAFFSGADAGLTVTRVPVGYRRGLRDMAVVPQGILLLAGPDDHPDSRDAGWAVSLWDDKSAGRLAAPRLLATLDLRTVARSKCDDDTKPEAMALLEETAQAYRVLVLSDGMCDGGPLVFDIPR